MNPSFRMVLFPIILSDSNLDFRVKSLCSAEYIRNGARYRQNYNELLTGTYAVLKSVTSNDLE